MSDELWIKCICAWNNVPPDNEAMRQWYRDNVGKVSMEGWNRVAAAVREHDNHAGDAPRTIIDMLNEMHEGQRLTVFRAYCTFCGAADPRCPCMKDY